MSDVVPRVSAAFGLTPAEKGNLITEDSAREFAEVVAEALKGPAALKPFQLQRRVQEELLRGFDTPVWQLAAQAWNKRDELRKYADPAQTPPDETHQVWLVEHKVRQAWHPVVEVRVAGLPVTRLKFTAALELKFRGAALVVRGGRITHVRLGEVSTRAAFSAGAAKLVERTVATWELPDEVSLGEGIRIPPPPPAASAPALG